MKGRTLNRNQLKKLKSHKLNRNQLKKLGITSIGIATVSSTVIPSIVNAESFEPTTTSSNYQTVQADATENIDYNEAAYEQLEQEIEQGSITDSAEEDSSSGIEYTPYTLVQDGETLYFTSQADLDRYVQQHSTPSINKTYGEYENHKVLKTEYKTTTVTPTGQPPGGKKFNSGGSFYVKDKTGAPITVSFNLSWGPVSVGVTPGSAYTAPTANTVLVDVPNNKDFFKVKLVKKYKFEHVKVDHYQYGKLQYSYYTTHKSWYSTEYKYVKV